MTILKRFVFASLLLHLGGNVLYADPANSLHWSTQERSILEQFSLTQLKPIKDPSNQYVNNIEAIKLGKQLFNEPLLSSNQKVSCSSCHTEDKHFTDNKVVALGARSGLRNTPTLLNTAQQNWFFWDGSKDSLWSQALSSIENPAEHHFNRVQLTHFIAENSRYETHYNVTFNTPLPSNNFISSLPKSAGPNGSLKELKAWKSLSKEQKTKVNLVAINLSKAIAAYVSTITFPPSRFDAFLEAILAGKDSDALSRSEQNGLKLFISKKSGCANCHIGAIFSNKEFHNIGTGIPARDNGRSEVIDSVIRSPFNCLGKYSDAKPNECNELKFAATNKHALSGAYKTPTLRGLSKTAPYMHDGRFDSLKDVLSYYASFNTTEKALSVDLPIIELTDKEQNDIVSFFMTL